ncbi:MAG: NAD-dependent epimerase/dehydratase family protein [Rickettsiales bacterium]|nr:NAD-dependent epimerase/dehydratase family protein [Rickettsiales bacterium]
MNSQGFTFITGASGFVGAAVARALLARGHQVRALVRPSSPRGNLSGLDVELFEGDMRDAAAMQRAISGARYVFHVAADYRLWARDAEEIVCNNLDSTRAVMEAAMAADVERVVYTSSVAALKPDNSAPADETRPAKPHEAVGVYKRSKVVAERLVEEMVAERGLRAVIVNPSTPIGPRDIRPTPTGRVLVEVAHGRVPVYVESGLNLVHVDDVAAGHLLALDHGRLGERYILGGDDVPLIEMLTEIARLTNRRPPFLRLPRQSLFPLAWLNEQRFRIMSGSPFLTLDSLRMAKHQLYFSSAKAKAELGYVSRPYQEALRDAVDWFRSEGRIP